MGGNGGGVAGFVWDGDVMVDRDGLTSETAAIQGG